MFTDLWIRLRSLFRRNAVENELDAELRFHFDQQVEKFVASGLLVAEARRRARLTIGGADQIKEECREARGVHFFDTLAQDIRYGLRMLGKSSGFTAVAILTLALGIGANTAIFSVVDAVVLRPLPAKDPQQLALFTWTAHAKPKFHGHSGYGDCDYEESERDCAFSVPLFKTMSAQASSFSSVTAFAGPLEMDLSGNGPARIADGEFVSGNFFSSLGVTTILGRPLGPSDDSVSASPAIVLNYGYWQRAFGGDRAAVGRTVRLNNVPLEIVGVADPRFPDL